MTLTNQLHFQEETASEGYSRLTSPGYYVACPFNGVSFISRFQLTIAFSCLTFVGVEKKAKIDEIQSRTGRPQHMGLFK